MKLFVLSVILAAAWAESNPESNAVSGPDPQYTNLLASAVNAYAHAPEEAVASPVSSQYHAQSELGEYAYGFSNHLSSKQETKSADGVVQGSYSYASPDGRVITNNYVSDDYGFRSSLAPSNGEHASLQLGPYVPDVAYDLPSVADIAPEIVAAYDEPALRVHQAVPGSYGILEPSYPGNLGGSYPSEPVHGPIQPAYAAEPVHVSAQAGHGPEPSFGPIQTGYGPEPDFGPIQTGYGSEVSLGPVQTGYGPEAALGPVQSAYGPEPSLGSAQIGYGAEPVHVETSHDTHIPASYAPNAPILGGYGPQDQVVGSIEPLHSVSGAYGSQSYGDYQGVSQIPTGGIHYSATSVSSLPYARPGGYRYYSGRPSYSGYNGYSRSYSRPSFYGRHGYKGYGGYRGSSNGYYH